MSKEEADKQTEQQLQKILDLMSGKTEPNKEYAEITKKLFEKKVLKMELDCDGCPSCGSKVERHYIPLMGPYNGTVKCTACDYRNSLIGYIGQKCIVVENLDNKKGTDE